MDNEVINDIVEELKELRQEIKELKAELYKSKEIKVGDTVKFTSGRYAIFQNRVGKVIEADDSDMPYCVEFDNDQTLWVFESDVELI